MSSLFSFAGNFASFMHIYQQLYDTPEFQDFTDYLNEGTPKEVMHTFFRNMLFKKIDGTIENYLKSQELQQIMSNQKMNHQDKCKLVGGKITNYIMNHHPFFNTSRENVDLSVNFIDRKKKIIEDTLASINKMENLQQVETVSDVYTVVIDDLAKELTEFIYGLLTTFTDIQMSEEEGLIIVRDLLKQFNDTYEYQSDLCNDDLFDHHSDDSDESNSDADDEGDEMPENKKRTFDEMNEGDKDVENPENKKPKQ